MRRILATVVVVLVGFAPTTALATAWFRCAMDGELRAACCCPDEVGAAEHDAGAPPVVAPASCCDRVARDVAAAQARTLTESGAAALAALAPAPIVVELARPIPDAARRAAPPSPRPPGRAPPLFLANCSLLI